MAILLHYKYIAHGALGPVSPLMIWLEIAGRAAMDGISGGVDVVKRDKEGISNGEKGQTLRKKEIWKTQTLKVKSTKKGRTKLEKTHEHWKPKPWQCLR